MTPTSKSFGLRISGAFQNVSRTTASVAISGSPLPGFEEVKRIARRLVDGIEKKCETMSRRITSIVSMLEAHCQLDELSLELQYFLNKMATCQQKLLSFDSKRGLSKALRASQQLEMIDTLEQEINTDLQDAIFALLLRRTPSSPVPNVKHESANLPLIPAPQKPIIHTLHKPSYEYPKIIRCELSLGALVRRTRVGRFEGSLFKTVATGRYKSREVFIVQYSSKLRAEDASKAFLSDLADVIGEQHPNVLELIGASEAPLSSQNYYMVFNKGKTIPRDTFLKAAYSAQQIFEFLGGVKSGMQCLLDHGVQNWHDIYVSDDGRAVVCPPYWENDQPWDKSNHDVFSSLTGTSGCPDFPLNTLTEILNISGDRWREFETAVASLSTRTRDYHLMRIANELQLPVPPFLLVYYGKLPDFILAVGSLGIPDYLVTGQPGDCFHGSMNGWIQVSSLWACTGWEALHTCSLDYWLPSDSLARDGAGSGDELAVDISSGVLSIQPLDSCSDGWLSYGEFESELSFGVGYELVISDSELFEHSWDRFCSTRLGSIMHLVDEEQDYHAVKHVNVSVHCQSDELRGLFPLYFHRRPSSLFNVKHYWGFFSDSSDPRVAPCHLVKNMTVNYSIEINTTRANDSWTYRGEKCLDMVISKTPGTFKF